MDLEMQVESITTTEITWDCNVENGCVPILTDDEEDMQCAIIAGFLIRGTVPQLENAGVPWTEFLTGKLTFGELDFYVRDSLNTVGKDTYYPQYDVTDDQLTMSIGQMKQEETYNEL